MAPRYALEGDVAPPGALQCQKDSSTKTIETTVVSCTAVAEGAQYEVELADTVIFPEGGGQPSDTGKIDDQVVQSAYVKDGRCLHCVAGDDESPFATGQRVTATVDWDRRFDHMQQHSGQHLLSAIAEKYGYNTSTWAFGDERCNVELVSTTGAKQIIPSETLKKIESDVNDAIVSGASMQPQFAVPDTPEWDAIAAKFDENERPAVMRVVCIDGIDMNPCCGTHVQSLGQLQSLRILNVEFARGASRVWFVVGNRVNNEFARMFNQEQRMTKLLTSGPSEHANRVDKLLQTQKAYQKAIKQLQKELAEFIGKDLRLKDEQVVHYHRSDGDPAFLQAVLKSVGDAKDTKTYLLTAGNLKGDGVFVLAGPSSFIQDHGAVALEPIKAKSGKAKNGVMQGKAMDFSKIKETIEKLQA